MRKPENKAKTIAVGGQRFGALLFSLEEILTVIAAQPERSLAIIRRRVAGLTEAELTRFLLRTRRAVGLRGEVGLLVTASRELQALNRRFRKMNKPTDVLTFPAAPNLLPGFAGDVAISAEIAARNARRLGHTVADEVRVLTLHGVLHLAGYDHEQDNGEMERKETRLRKSLGLPSALIERVRSQHSQAHLQKGSEVAHGHKPIRPPVARASRKSR